MPQVRARPRAAEILGSFTPRYEISYDRVKPGRVRLALVRHVADPGVALAGVLGVPAEDIRVRDRPE
jgi:hypothetical protein